MNLAKAIERAKQLYSKALHHAVGANVLADAWSYGIKSSGLWATAAGLIQYGLLHDDGTGDKRKFKLTDAAIRIIRDADPLSEKRINAIQRAALLPPIHRELWNKFLSAAQVHDIVIRNYLTLDRADEGKAPYSDASAEEVIRSYKETITFAGIGQSDTLPDAGEDKSDDGEPIDPLESNDPAKANQRPITPAPSSSAELKSREVKIMAGERELTTGLLSKGASFRLIVTGSIGVKEIERLIAKLEIDKEILAESDDADEEWSAPLPQG
jgi:hypothetical protein